MGMYYRYTTARSLNKIFNSVGVPRFELGLNPPKGLVLAVALHPDEPRHPSILSLFYQKISSKWSILSNLLVPFSR